MGTMRHLLSQKLVGLFATLLVLFVHFTFAIRIRAQLCGSPPAGEIDLWNGDNASLQGDAQDLIGGNNLSINGGVSIVQGKVGKAFHLDGFTGYLTIPDNASLDFKANIPFTLEGWFNYNNQGCQNCLNAGILNIIRKSIYPPSGLAQGYWVRVYAKTEQLSFFAGSETAPAAWAEIVVSITPNTWHHFAATRDSSGNMTLYVDGKPAGSASGASGDTTSPAPFSIGAWNDRFGLIELFSGDINEISIYNRALTADEVRGLYNACGCATAAVTTRVFNNRTEIELTFKPDAGLTLADAASRCGYIHYNWLSLVTASPRPCVAPILPFFDPLPPGALSLLCLPYQPCHDVYPYYWDEPVAAPSCTDPRFLAGNPWNTPDAYTFIFSDAPHDFLYAGPGAYMQFRTFLVGLRSLTNPEIIPFGSKVGLEWKSNSNGRSGTGVEVSFGNLDGIVGGTGEIFDIQDVGLEDLSMAERSLLLAAGVKNIDFSNIALHLPPQCSAGGPYTAECGGVISTVPLDGSASTDPNDSPLTFSWSSDCPGATFDDFTSPRPSLIFDSTAVPDTCNVRLMVENSFGLTSTCTTTVTVKDTLPPNIGPVTATPAVIWPPNHKFVDVIVGYTATDQCDSNPSTSVSVASNEPINGVGDGNTSPDWDVVDSHHVRLRAERSGTGSGRIYTLTVKATDSSGNSSTKVVTVTVPKSQGK